MARARNIKPATFMNEVLAECSPLARLLFIGLWTVADKEGRLEDRPKKIKAELLSYDTCDADSLLDELFSRGFINRYAVENNRYIHIVNFAKHQHPHPKEPPSVIPEPGKEISFPVKTMAGTSLPSSSLIPSSLIPHPLLPCAALHENLSTAPTPEPTPEPTPTHTPEPTPKPKKEKRGERLEAFLEREGVDAVCKTWGEWALGEGASVEVIDREMAKFRDYWKAVSGGKGCKLDWPATWRNWMRKVLEQIQEQERRDAIFRQKRGR